MERPSSPDESRGGSGGRERRAKARSKPGPARVLVGLTVLLALVGGAGYVYWTTVQIEKRTEQICADLTAKGIDISIADGEPRPAAIPLFQSMTSSKIVRVYAGKSKITDADLSTISGIRQDLDLTLDVCPVTDVGLSNLHSSPNVRWLKLRGTAITNDGLKHLKGMELESLDLTGTKIDDAGLAALAQMEFPRLRELSLASTGVTDEGLTHLAKFQSLEFLATGDTKVTADGRRRLRVKIPGVSVSD